MPLSEHDELLLAQIERDLAADDPKLARSVRRQTPRRYSLTRLRRSLYVFLLGIAILISSVIVNSPIASVLLGILAFTVMLLAALHGARDLRQLVKRPTKTSRS